MPTADLAAVLGARSGLTARRRLTLGLAEPVLAQLDLWDWLGDGGGCLGVVEPASELGPVGGDPPGQRFVVDAVGPVAALADFVAGAVVLALQGDELSVDLGDGGGLRVNHRRPGSVGWSSTSAA